MKIKDVKAFAFDLAAVCARRDAGRIERPRSSSFRWQGLEPAGPMERYPAYKGRRSSASTRWNSTACIVTVADGTYGLGISNFSGPVVSIINGHFAPQIEGEDCMATGKIFGMLSRLASPYGSYGLASYAISAVD